MQQSHGLLAIAKLLVCSRPLRFRLHTASFVRLYYCIRLHAGSNKTIKTVFDGEPLLCMPPPVNVSVTFTFKLITLKNAGIINSSSHLENVTSSSPDYSKCSGRCLFKAFQRFGSYRVQRISVALSLIHI